MISVNPFSDLRNECTSLLKDSLERLCLEVDATVTPLEIPRTRKFGELTSSICFELAKKVKKPPFEMADQIVRGIDLSSARLVKQVKEEGGYINFYADFANFSSLTIKSVRKLNEKYGYVKTERPERIIVEHTSANPISPIHIGAARNSILGDSLARLLKARGHKVFRHYYIDDVGRQSAIVAYGYNKLGRPKPKGKPDHFIGAIYSVTSCLLEIQRIKKEIERLKDASIEDLINLRRSLDDWMSIAFELESKYPDLFNKLLNEISKLEDSEFEVSQLIQGYEKGEEKAKQLIREVCQMGLEGFKQTLDRAEITFDSWDWESGFVWNGEVTRNLNELKKTPFVFEKGGVLEFDADKAARSLGLRGLLGLKDEYEIPSLTLVRADGTTLYTTRDIAYSLWKFERADRVINVVGVEQNLAQLQLKLALCALGYIDEAKRLIHFAYNLVSIPGYRMSGRRGRYITFDEVMDEAINRAYEEVSKRSPKLKEEKKREISEIVGIGAVKFALIETDPIKPVVFTWDRVLNFEMNSAPYIQYSHARACSILRKAAKTIEDGDYSLLKESLEREIILMMARFPEVFINAADNLKPNEVADFAVAIADKFNTFYAKYPVIKAGSISLSDARLGFVDAVRIILRNALSLLGIEAPQRM